MKNQNNSSNTSVLPIYDLGIIGMEPLNDNFMSLEESQAELYAKKLLTKLFSVCKLENKKECQGKISSQILSVVKSKYGNRLSLRISNLINSLFYL